MAVWLPFLFGTLDVPTAFDPTIWHAHEMVFGFAGAAVAGYVLTLIPNWTGTFPLQGRPLALLVGLWIAGRLAVTCSALVGPAAAMIVDLALPMFLLVAAARGRHGPQLAQLAGRHRLVPPSPRQRADPSGAAGLGPHGRPWDPGRLGDPARPDRPGRRAARAELHA